MLFTTGTFLIFLLIVFLVYWRLVTVTRQNLFLVASSYVFYGWWDYRFCALMLASSVGDYWFGRLIARAEVKRAKVIVALSITLNLVLLGFFKYYHFFASSIEELFRAVGWHADFPTLYIILPVGISFYTFQSMSYVIDVYRRQLKPASRLLDYLAYVSFFPQLVAGPIGRGAQLLPQFLSSRAFDELQAVEGLRLMLWGFVKKMVIADNLALLVDQAYASPSRFDGAHLGLATLCFAFQIYADFSGYSDIATGTARLFGSRLMRNFSYPYFSQNLAEFWRRWHISLSTWFKDYLYFPLGGSRVSRIRFAWNVMATFVVSGLWHGAAWTFVIWGALNGVGVLTANSVVTGRTSASGIAGGEGWLPQPRAALAMIGTFSFTCLAWVFFRAQSLHDAGLILSRFSTWPFSSHKSQGFDTFLSPKGTLLLIGAFVAVEWLTRGREHPFWFPKWSRPARWVAYTLVIWTMFYLRPVRTGSFVYFQF